MYRYILYCIPIAKYCVQPPPPGQKRKREDWELLWYGGMFGGMLFGGVLLYYKPDSRYVVNVDQTVAV